MKFKKKSPLVRVDGRANREDVETLKANNINLSLVIRAAIEKMAKGLKS